MRNIGRLPLVKYSVGFLDVLWDIDSISVSFYFPSNNVDSFTQTVVKMIVSDIKAMKEKGNQF